MASGKNSKRRSKASADLQVIPAICQALLAIAEDRVDEQLLVSIFGDLKWRSQNEIAAAFGVSNSTIVGSWRRNGMPGEQGNYAAVEIVRWLLSRRIQEKQRQPQQDAIGSRKREIELRAAEIDLAKREREEASAVGTAVPTEYARAEISAMIAVAKHTLESISRDITPMLPTNLKDSVPEEVKKLVQRCLRFMSVKSGQIIGEAIPDLLSGKDFSIVDVKIAKHVKRAMRVTNDRSNNNPSSTVSGRRGRTSAANPASSSRDASGIDERRLGEVEGARH